MIAERVFWLEVACRQGPAFAGMTADSNKRRRQSIRVSRSAPDDYELWLHGHGTIRGVIGLGVGCIQLCGSWLNAWPDSDEAVPCGTSAPPLSLTSYTCHRWWRRPETRQHGNVARRGECVSYAAERFWTKDGRVLSEGVE